MALRALPCTMPVSAMDTQINTERWQLKDGDTGRLRQEDYELEADLD